MRTEIYSEGALVEWFGTEGTDYVHVQDGIEVERRPATAEELTEPEAPQETPDLVTLAARQAEIAEAVDYLILMDLMGDLG